MSYEISGTEVGPYEGAFSGTPVVKAEGSDDDLAANYKFSYTEGKLNIVASAIAQYVKLEPADVTEVYDGKAHQAGTATATDANGKTAKVEYSVDGEKWTEGPGRHHRHRRGRLRDRQGPRQRGRAPTPATSRAPRSSRSPSAR